MFFKIMVMLGLLSISKGTRNDTHSCGENSIGYEITNQTGHCYKFYTQPANWTTAQWICAGQGARLAVINSDAEARVLINLFEQYPPAAIHGESFSTGANSIPVGIYYESHGWRTVDGQTLEQAGYAKWSEDGRPPHIETDYPYGFMLRQGTLENGSNYVKHPFICEKAFLPF